MAISDAVGLELKSKVVGYKIVGTNFNNSTPNLPQRIALLAEANTPNQSGLSTAGVQVTSAQQVGELAGYGSPAHSMARILFPKGGGGLIGGIPVILYLQEEAGSAAAKVHTVTATGTATGNGTHTLYICGRNGLDGVFYDINIAVGDNATAVATKAKDAINAVLGCPVSATNTAGVVTATSKWKGLTADDISITVSTNGDALGISWAVASTASGAGTPAISTALDQFGSAWNTIVVNPYSASAVYSALEAFNGIPDAATPTGRYAGIIMKPFIAITGSTLENPTTVTDGRAANVTIAIAPAPLSKGLPYEAAANMTCLFARKAQDTPHLDVSGSYYPDMPAPLDGNIGAMSSYVNRNSYLTKGSSTVELVAGRYQVVDFVTTYHPAGEDPLQFNYCRNLMLDFNIRFAYYVLEQINVVDHVISSDSATVTASKVIKPKMWKSVVTGLADDLAARALIAEPQFMKDSIRVQISSVNPDRLETNFSYKRTGVARILSTTANAGFNFGAA